MAQERPRLPVDSLPSDLFESPAPKGWPRELVLPTDEDTRALFSLGRRLFFDPILSEDRTVACASCHDPAHGFTTPDAHPLGIRGQRALRNAPSVINRALGTHHSWDGRAETLEAQMLLPIANPLEMGFSVDLAVARVKADQGYGPLIASAKLDAWDAAGLSVALATFVRRLRSGDSRIDRFRAGEVAALSAEVRGGLWIFESKGRCWKCHSGPNFSDERFHNTGVGVVEGRVEDGRFAITGKPEDRGRFKTASLRDLVHTAPYMHDGSLKTLEDVVAFYRKGGHANPQLDPDLMPIDMDDRDAAHLVEFLKALSR